MATGLDDTIAAISTGLGEAGIGIVRMSGPQAVNVVEKVFVPKTTTRIAEKSTYTLTYGRIVDPSTGQVVDEVIVGLMLAPFSYTKEDVVEINCHGGALSQRKILELVLDHGCRLAEPGEFTKRAFLNGRIDLIQAEAVMEIIRAKTDESLEAAMSHLDGGLTRRIEDVRENLLKWIAQIEASIDFPEEEIEPVSGLELKSGLYEQVADLKDLIQTAETGKILREGYKVVIAGKPNVGKSSLLNAILRESRAIVTEIPGTTRDAIEEWVNIRGVGVVLTDTAGIRATHDVVETLGVELTRKHISHGDLTLIVLDDTSGITPEDNEILRFIQEGINAVETSELAPKVVVVVNKIDVGQGKIRDSDIVAQFGSVPILRISVIKHQGIDRLETLIGDMARQSYRPAKGSVVITRVRHKIALERAVVSLEHALRGIAEAFSLDLVSIDIRGAWEALGEITGQTAGEDIVDRIFSDFCLGK